jgi:RNA polymerase sigma factor for flagellar operon FliA
MTKDLVCPLRGAIEIRMIISETDAAEAEAPSCAKSRDELILEHLPQVKLIAKRLQKSLPASVSLDDLISSGIVGLIAAVDRYDPKQEVKLKTYAEYKIRGAILDSLRMLDWAPREKRKRARLIEAATADLEKEHCRTPREEEVASKLGLPVRDYREWVKDAHGLAIASLDAPRTQADGTDLLSCISGSMQEWPSEVFERAELKRVVMQCIEEMPPIEQTVLSLYFYEERTLRDIAKRVDLHESRISQLKSQAISRLRAYLQTYWPFERSLLPARVEHHPTAGIR